MIESWKSIVKPREGFELREGQAQALDAVYETADDRMLAVLPTGYGKSEVAVGAFAILKSRGIVNRALWVVPQDLQRKQAANSIARRCRNLGIPKINALIVTKSAKEFRYHQTGAAEVFVATYQQITSGDGHFVDLLESGKWLVIFDECHHLAKDGKWGPYSHELPAAFRLYLSATPMRSDGKPLKGVPVIELPDGGATYKADVEVSFARAVREHAIKRPVAHIEHYFVDVEIGASGISERIDTKKLRADGIETEGDLNAYETKRELRYCDAYLSRMIADSLSCLDAKQIRSHRQHQMLVFAMTCKHAEAVARHYNLVSPGCADWIGVTRDDRENQSVLDRYLANKLDVLVQVDKAGEGFDNCRTSVLVFLHLVKAQGKLLQQIGRGLRRNYGIDDYEHDLCDVFASADTDIADTVKTLDVECREFRAEAEPRDGEAEYQMGTIPDLSVVNAEWHRTDRVAHGEPELVVSDIDVDLARKFNVTPELAAAMRMEWEARRPGPSVEVIESESERLARIEGNVKKAVNTLSRNIVLANSGSGVFRRELLGDAKRAIHSKWIMDGNPNTDSMTATEMDSKYRWLQSMNNAVRNGELPSWARL